MRVHRALIRANQPGAGCWGNRTRKKTRLHRQSRGCIRRTSKEVDRVFSCGNKGSRYERFTGIVVGECVAPLHAATFTLVHADGRERMFWPVQFWLARNDVNVNAQRRGTRKLLPLSKHGARSVARPHRASASIHISYVGLAVFLCLFSAFVFLFVVCLVGGG